MNIIYISTDTFRYDNIFGPQPLPVRTPHLEAFAKRATVLNNMIMASFPTIPQRTDVFTGRFGWPWYGWQPIDCSSKNELSCILAGHGYATQLLCDCPHLFKSRFDRGFEAAEAVRGQEGDLHFLHLNDPIEKAMPPEKTRGSRHFQDRNLLDLHVWMNHRRHYESDLFMAQTAQRTMQWLEDNHRHEPFFLWVDFFDPHEPWDPPEYLVRRYDPDYDGIPMLHPNYGRADDLSPAELFNLAAHYYGEAELVDRWIGRVLEKIEDLELWDNTVVVVASDHGISLGEHNRTGKSNNNDGDDRFWPTYPEIAHELFLIAAPDLVPGRSLEMLAQPVDIAPTLLELCGVDATTPEPMHGLSFVPQLQGKKEDQHREIAICASHLGPMDYGEVPNKAVTPALYTLEWIFVPIGPDGRSELYNRQQDPLATNNVAAENPTVLSEMGDRFRGWLRQHDVPKSVEASLFSER